MPEFSLNPSRLGARLRARLRGEQSVSHAAAWPPPLDGRPATHRNTLVALRAHRDRAAGAGATSHANGQTFDVHHAIRTTSAAVREQDAAWLADVVRGEQTLPDIGVEDSLPADASARDSAAAAARAAGRRHGTFDRVFGDVDQLRSLSDVSVRELHAQLDGELRDPSATFGNSDRHTARAVFAEVQRETKLRPQARTLFAQRAFDAAADSAFHLGAAQKIELAADVRQHATEWFGANADSEQALEALAEADQQYAQTVVEAKPQWLEATLGVEPADEHLAGDRNLLAEQIAHVRFGREDLADVAPGLDTRDDGRLLRDIERYQRVIGMIVEGPQHALVADLGIGM